MNDHVRDKEYDEYDANAVAKFHLAELMRDESLGSAEFLDGRKANLLRLLVFHLRSEILALCEKTVA